MKKRVIILESVYKKKKREVTKQRGKNQKKRQQPFNKNSFRIAGGIPFVHFRWFTGKNKRKEITDRRA